MITVVTDVVRVSTHSRAKAAGSMAVPVLRWIGVSTHSRAKAAGDGAVLNKFLAVVSTHSRAKAAGPPYCVAPM